MDTEHNRSWNKALNTYTDKKKTVSTKMEKQRALSWKLKILMGSKANCTANHGYAKGVIPPEIVRELAYLEKHIDLVIALVRKELKEL